MDNPLVAESTSEDAKEKSSEGISDKSKRGASTVRSTVLASLFLGGGGFARMKAGLSVNTGISISMP